MEEFRVLMERVKAGDKKAREVLIEENLGLVRHVVKRFSGSTADQEELFQIGVIGLMQAIDRFDPSREVMFSTYAVPVILGEIRRFLREDTPVKVSRSIRENACRVSKARETLAKRLGREPRIDELAREAGLSREDTLLAMEADLVTESLDTGKEVEDGSIAPLGERIASDGEGRVSLHPYGDAEKEKLIDHIVLKQLWEGLSKEEQRILWLRYFRDKTQVQVSARLGISQVQVSRKEKKILEKMRKNAQHW